MSYDCQILVCSTARELPWLNLCLQSARKYWEGLGRPIVVVTPDCKTSLPSIVAELKSCVIFKEKPLHDYIRLTADSYMEARSVVFLDTRELFNTRCRPSSLMDKQGRPMIYIEGYHPNMERACADDNSIHGQRWVIDELLGSLPEYEFTCRRPLLFLRSSIRRLRESIETKNKRPLLQVMRMYDSSYVSPFNLLGHYCYTNENSAYAWDSHTNASKSFLTPFWGIREPAKGEDYRAIKSILEPESLVRVLSPLTPEVFETVSLCSDIVSA